MNPITFPLRPRMQEPAVVDLQDALQLCLDRGVILANDETARRRMSAALTRERAEQRYGDTTALLVSRFQIEQGLQRRPSGEVDEPTAAALNALLQEWGEINTPPEPQPPQERLCVVSGQVRYDNNEPLPRVQVRAVHEAEQGAIPLGEATTDVEGRYTIHYDPRLGGDSVNLRVTVWDARGNLLCESEVIYGARLRESVDLSVPTQLFVVRGQVRQVRGAYTVLLPGLRVRAVHEAEQGAILLGEATTDDTESRYTIHYDPRLGGDSINLRVTVWDARDNLLCESEVIYGARLQESVDLSVPTQRFVVRGQVRRADNGLLPGVRVRAVHEAEQGAIPLGEATTDADGRYTIHYDLLPRGASVNLHVTVRDARGNLLRESDVLRGARLQESVDLSVPTQRFVVRGQVRYDNNEPLPGVWVRAVHEAERRTFPLGEARTDADGRYIIHYDLRLGGDSINLRVTVWDARGNLLCQSEVIYGAQLRESVDLSVPSVSTRLYRVEGKVASRISAGVGGLRVVIVDKGVGGDVAQGDVELAHAFTDDGGAYQIPPFSDSKVRGRGKAQPDLQARVFADEAFLGASDVRYNASQYETMHVLLADKAASALRSEHDVLTNALASQFQGNLGDLKETDEQQDVTYLANKTGWDARAVALAALADQYSAQTVDGSGVPAIPQAFFYALFRAGLPANAHTLYHTDTKTLENVWRTAAEQGVISKDSANEIPKMMAHFQTFSAQKLLTGPALVGVSSLQEMLTASHLNEAQQERFAQLYAVHRTDMPRFWEAVGEAPHFGATPAERRETVNRLQVDGKLGFLTINNASLMQRVHESSGGQRISNLLQLVQIGYYHAAEWRRLLTAHADIPIPQEIPGDTETRRENYANYLAAQVRLSYPTACIAQMVKSTEIPLTGAAQGVSDQVHAFLTEHQDTFEIGVHSIQQYIKDKKLTDANITPETVEQVKRLQRVYQITPSDEAMIGLMKRGIDAASHVVRYDKDTFVQSFAADVGGAVHAALTYDRAVQIHNAVLNIALSYLTARTAPAIGVHSPSSVLDPTPANAGDVIASATLESLFDSMDFCACDHCRSILSPAAYLVDLLQFLDNSPTNPTAPVLYTDRATGKQKHVTPLDILVGNKDATIVGVGLRPDIQHLPLTCENTNIALPYIDVVNETLEYYIANDIQNLSLKDYQGYDTNGVASEDLLASPQFVMEEAYKTLRGEHFPAPLPFHQSLENLRRYFNKFEVPLPLAMERLRKSDVLDIDRKTNPPPPLTDYDWRDILIEELGLSRAENDILTKLDVNHVNDALKKIFGFPSKENDPIAKLSNVKQFARHVAISYDDLIAILKTRFINPNSDLIPKLERLGVTFAMLAELKTKNDALTDAKFDALLAALAVPPDPAEYGDDPNAPKNDYTPIRAWVKNDGNYARIMGIITLTTPAGNWAPSKVYAKGDCVRPTAAQPESTLYYECTTSGTSAVMAPKWSTTPGKPCSDGSVVWTCRDDSSCLSFDNLAFRYSDPAKLTQNISAVEFVRLLRFIRLWKKLGWTIEQTDKAITALYPANQMPNAPDDAVKLQRLNDGFRTLLPRLGIVKRVMKALDLTPKRDLLPLLACFAPIDTHDGTEWFIDKDQSRRLRPIPSLYRQLFLNPTMLAQDAVFMDNGYGEFLHDSPEKLLAHAEVLRSAFNLTGDEFDLIIDDLGFNTVVEVPYTHLKPSLEQSIVDVGPGIGYDNQHKRLSYTGLLSATTRDALKAVSDLTAEFKAAVDALYLANQSALRPLTLTDISAIFRRGWLARKLKLSVRELLLLTQFTGLDPFAAPDPPNPALLRLIELVQSMKDRSFTSAAALYLIWNQDLSGKSAPDSAQVADLARTLRLGLAALETEFAVADDPDGTIARARMALVYGNDATNLFFGFLDNTFVTSVRYDRAAITFVTKVAYTHSHPTLEQAILDAAPHQIAYDDTTRTLSFTGTLTDTVRNELKEIAGITEDFKNAVDVLYNENQRVVQANLEQPVIHIAPGRIYYDDFRKKLSFSGILTDNLFTDNLLNALLNVQVNGAPLSQAFKDALQSLYQENKKVVAPFFARYPELQPLYDAYASDATHAVTEKRSKLLKTILPELVQRRKRQYVLQSVSAVANTDPAFTQTFLDPSAAPFPLHAAGDANQPALQDFLALEKHGLSVQFFASDTVPGAIIPSPPSPEIASKLDYAPLVGGVGNPLPANPTTPGAAISGIWRGYLEAPESGFFNVHIEADTGAKITLGLDGKPVESVRGETPWKNQNPIELRAGTFYAINLTVENVRNVVRVQWEWTPKGQGRAVIHARYLYPAEPFETFEAAYVRFLKAASLAQGLGLTANELAYLATHADYNVNGEGWLNALPVSGTPVPATATAFLKPFEALLDFARIKTDISPGDESLLTALKDPTAATQKKESLLFTITRWNSTSLNDVLARFSSNVTGLRQFELFRRVYDVFALTQKMGISANALIDATTNEPKDKTVRDLQAALRARYDAASWRDVVRPINDEMRSLQRDALVAYILHHMRSHPESEHIDTPDKLFEYFLMDVQMDPCMQTSRIRHALSSVQLFIERCLMNLEPRVSPTAINPQQWAWMKRYRVWEANRKVYLFPENWLEPELRDDKSPFFKEIESELLQSDITEERAATALLNYLSKLEEVAKLEPCGLYHIPDPDERTDGINHVVARTTGANRKYYYRRSEYGSWTPWEQIKLDIEDNPVIPVVWNDRLFLFWLRILKQTPPDNTPPQPTAKTLADISPSEVILPNQRMIRVHAVLCFSEYYNGKWQPTKTSDVNAPVNLGSFIRLNDFHRSELWLEAVEWPLAINNKSKRRALRIFIFGHAVPPFSSFLLYNTHGLPIPDDNPLDACLPGKFRSLSTMSPTFTIDNATWVPDSDVPSVHLKRSVLTNTITYSCTQPLHHPHDPWKAPFLFEDSRHVFFVTTTEQPVRILDYVRYGVLVDLGRIQVPEIPPLVLQVDPKVPVPPKPWGDGGPIGPDPGVIDPAPMQRFVTEDAYIRQGIGTTGVVTFGGKQIGPSGAIRNVRSMQ